MIHWIKKVQTALVGPCKCLIANGYSAKDLM